MALPETRSLAHVVKSWVSALQVVGGMIGEPYMTHDKCPCHMTCGWLADLRLAQDLIYYFLNQYVFIDCISGLAGPGKVFCSELGGKSSQALTG